MFANLRFVWSARHSSGKLAASLLGVALLLVSCADKPAVESRDERATAGPDAFLAAMEGRFPSVQSYCAGSGAVDPGLRLPERPCDADQALVEIGQSVCEAAERGATEAAIQGQIELTFMAIQRAANSPREEWALPQDMAKLVDEAEEHLCQNGSVQFDPSPAPAAGETAARDQAPEAAQAPPASGERYECPVEPVERVRGEQAALCLYQAWKLDERGLATTYASEEAVAALFETAWSPPDGDFNGCEQYGDQAVCTFNWHPGWIQMYLGGTPSLGNYVETVAFMQGEE